MAGEQGTREHNSAIRKDERLTAIWDNMGASREYHAKQNKSDRKRQEPYDFTHVGYKTEGNKCTNKTNKQKLIDTGNSKEVTQGKAEWEELEEGKGAQVEGDGRKLNFE